MVVRIDPIDKPINELYIFTTTHENMEGVMALQVEGTGMRYPLIASTREAVPRMKIEADRIRAEQGIEYRIRRFVPAVEDDITSEFS